MAGRIFETLCIHKHMHVYKHTYVVECGDEYRQIRPSIVTSPWGDRPSKTGEKGRLDKSITLLNSHMNEVPAPGPQHQLTVE